jgi:F-type H+-transporting ATPase subunit epsilon
MRMPKLKVEVVTGERVVFEQDDVDMVVARTADGVAGILPRHVPLIGLLEPGEMCIKKGGQEETLAVFGGFLEVAYNQVRVLADSAERAEEIDLARAEAARQRAETRLGQQASDIDLARAQMALQRSMLRLKVGRRSHAGRPGRAGHPDEAFP